MLKRHLWLLALPVAVVMAACGGAPAAPASGTDGVPGGTEGTTSASSNAPAKLSTSLGSFVPMGRMRDARKLHVTLLLNDGRVLVSGGRDKGTKPTRLEKVTIFDPATGEWTETASMAERREWHTGHVLEDGRVFVTGGRDNIKYHRDTEFYDPDVGSWSAGPRMANRRFEHASVLLPDGRVLVTGGTNDLVAPLSDSEMYDPETNEFSFSGSLVLARAQHTETLLNDGRVLVAGGSRGGIGGEIIPFDTAELYDPASGTWSEAGKMTKGHADHTATLLSDGRVLVTGGRGKVASTEIYDPATNTWSAAGSMSEWRVDHTATLLSDGRVLVTGGIGKVDSTDIFEPEAGAWYQGGTMTEPRYVHTATRLADGRVLLVGGQTTDGAGNRELSNTAELYEP